MNTFQVTVGHLDQLKTVLRSLENIQGVVSRRPGCDRKPAAMASNTRKTWKRRVRKHANMGKKRKAIETQALDPLGREALRRPRRARQKLARLACAEGERRAAPLRRSAGNSLAAVY